MKKTIKLLILTLSLLLPLVGCNNKETTSSSSSYDADKDWKIIELAEDERLNIELSDFATSGEQTSIFLTYDYTMTHVSEDGKTYPTYPYKFVTNTNTFRLTSIKLNIHYYQSEIENGANLYDKVGIISTAFLIIEYTFGYFLSSAGYVEGPDGNYYPPISELETPLILTSNSFDDPSILELDKPSYYFAQETYQAMRGKFYITKI